MDESTTSTVPHSTAHTGASSQSHRAFQDASDLLRLSLTSTLGLFLYLPTYLLSLKLVHCLFGDMFCIIVDEDLTSMLVTSVIRPQLLSQEGHIAPKEKNRLDNQGPGLPVLQASQEQDLPNGQSFRIRPLYRLKDYPGVQRCGLLHDAQIKPLPKSTCSSPGSSH